MKKRRKRIFAIILKIDGNCRSFFGLNELDLDFVKMICADLHLDYDIYTFEKTIFNSKK